MLKWSTRLHIKVDSALLLKCLFGCLSPPPFLYPVICSAEERWFPYYHNGNWHVIKENTWKNRLLFILFIKRRCWKRAYGKRKQLLQRTGLRTFLHFCGVLVLWMVNRTPPSFPCKFLHPDWGTCGPADVVGLQLSSAPDRMSNGQGWQRVVV